MQVYVENDIEFSRDPSTISTIDHLFYPVTRFGSNRKVSMVRDFLITEPFFKVPVVTCPKKLFVVFRIYVYTFKMYVLIVLNSSNKSFRKRNGKDWL